MQNEQKERIGSEPGRKHYRAQVVARRELTEESVWLELELEGFSGARPGQFVVIHCADQVDGRAGQSWAESTGWPQVGSAELRTKTALLRRPFSIADMPDGADGSRICLQFRILGSGTTWLAKNAQVGSELRLLGPLGNGFGLEGVRQAVLAAGRMGVAPMLFLARELVRQNSSVVLLAGAKSRRQLPLRLEEGALIEEEGEPRLCCPEFSELNVRVGIATDDGSLGKSGLLTDALADYLSRHWELAQTGTVVYTCGPELMMAKVSEIAQSRQLPVEVCLEQYMACGLGACQSCVCREKSAQERDGWAYKLVCTDGPIFDGQSILW